MITLRAHDLCWINEATEDPQDHCAHGTVEFRVNDSTFVKPEDGQWTVSGAALFLLRALWHDHTAMVRVPGGVAALRPIHSPCPPCPLW